MFRRVLETGKKAMFIVPFIAIAREKTMYFEHLCEMPPGMPRHLKVKGLFGCSGDVVGTANIVVCTFEKASSIINKAQLDGKLSESSHFCVPALCSHDYLYTPQRTSV